VSLDRAIDRRRTRARVFALAMTTGALVALGGAPAALADSTQSSNWAGYAVHRTHVSFDKVLGTWRQPTANCTGATPSYSSVWVGLGGFNLNAQALEQIGSEVDCSPTGQVVSTAWYELVPAPSRAIRMRVDPGDKLSASVTVSGGHQTRLTLQDLTRHTSFTRSLYVMKVDLGSAEWIVEAPSECSTPGSCQTLSLANFGTAAFSSARATSTAGHTGKITDHHWGITQIRLAAGHRSFIAEPAATAQALPSPLTAGGSAFSVTYMAAPTSTPPASTSPTSNRGRQSRVSAVGRLRAGGVRAR
jgi:Peptidase A4 family